MEITLYFIKAKRIIIKFISKIIVYKNRRASEGFSSVSKSTKLKEKTIDDRFLFMQIWTAILLINNFYKKELIDLINSFFINLISSFLLL